jgi:hypothetical protein
LFNIERYLTLALFTLICLPTVHAQSAQHVPARYRVESKETATLYVGKKGKFNIVLLDQYGNRLDSPGDLRTTITVTTLDTLEGEALKSEPHHRPLGITALSIFFLIGSLISFIAGFSLLRPGSFLEPMWD